MTATIHELPKATLADVPRVLRAIADEIEAGKYGKVDAAVIALECPGDVIRPFGAGAADYYRAIALFNMAASAMMRDKVQVSE